MPRATCRCGQKLSIPLNGPERVICPKCQARVRVRKDAPEAITGTAGGGSFIRFECTCGRRLKVRVTPGGEVPQAGKCPDCGRVVPVPSESKPSSSAVVSSRSQPPADSRTEEMDETDLAALDRWSQGYQAKRPAAVPSAAARAGEDLPATQSAQIDVVAPPVPASVATRVEAGLRVCPRCGRPVHLSAVVCRECGSHVPKR